MYNELDVHKLSDANLVTLATFARIISEALLYASEMLATIAFVLDEHVRLKRTLKENGHSLNISDVIEELSKMDECLSKQLEQANIVKFTLGKLWIQQPNNSIDGVHLWLMKDKIVEALENTYKCKFRVRFIRD